MWPILQLQLIFTVSATHQKSVHHSVKADQSMLYFVHVHWQFECCFQVTNTLVRATALGWLLNSLNPKQWEFSATCPGHVLRFYSQKFFGTCFSIYYKCCVYNYGIMLFTQQWLQMSQFSFNTFFFSWVHAKTRLLTSALLIGLLLSSLWCTLINMQKYFLILLCIMLAVYFIKTFIELCFARYHWQLQCVRIVFVLLFSFQVLYVFICTFCPSLILGGGGRGNKQHL